MFVIGSSIYFWNDWILNNVIKTQKKLLNKEAELNFLKQQLSPHFLLNSLNNLYGVSLSTPEIVSDKILELSDLLRYQVEATNKNNVPLSEEVKFVNDYLENAKYKSNKLIINLESKGEVLNENLPPLLFLPLIENAVKYSAECEQPIINAKWIFENNSICFDIENNFYMNSKIKSGTNIGLANLKRRLEILKQKYSFEIINTNPELYKTILKIWL
jgi:LytS/YehU family sensor histidine kinase